MGKLASQLFELLSIHSPSHEEQNVISYMLTELKPLVDEVYVDDKGNIFASKKCGPADYTVLLNAHMDTVARVKPIPYWRKGMKQIATNSNSALGGDDKCGLAVHLEVLRNVEKSGFSGTIKVLFSVAEEVGCVGATYAAKTQPEFFEGVDAAIVVDRQGGDDIVTSCFGEDVFCSDEYGKFWEEMSRKAGFKALVTEGSISDTMVFAETFGINSVNLAAGYYNPHTAAEHIKVNETIRTAKWVLAGLNNIQAAGKFPEFTYDSGIKKWDFGSWNDRGTSQKSVWYTDFCMDCGGEHEVARLWRVGPGEYVCEECIIDGYLKWKQVEEALYNGKGDIVENQ